MLNKWYEAKTIARGISIHEHREPIFLSNAILAIFAGFWLESLLLIYEMPYRAENRPFLPSIPPWRLFWALFIDAKTLISPLPRKILWTWAMFKNNKRIFFWHFLQIFKANNFYLWRAQYLLKLGRMNSRIFCNLKICSLKHLRSRAGSFKCHRHTPIEP